MFANDGTDSSSISSSYYLIRKECSKSSLTKEKGLYLIIERKPWTLL